MSNKDQESDRGPPSSCRLPSDRGREAREARFLTRRIMKYVRRRRSRGNEAAVDAVRSNTEVESGRRWSLPLLLLLHTSQAPQRLSRVSAPVMCVHHGAQGLDAESLHLRDCIPQQSCCRPCKLQVSFGSDEG
ncbi:hypothetical protein MRB53_037036 [Persea americana]|nr:hypothetical protein MRB53_037036 [Persea americana]